MIDLSSKLDGLLIAKNEIKKALIEKECTVTDETVFREYPEYIRKIRSGGSLAEGFATFDDFVKSQKFTDDLNPVIGNAHIKIFGTAAVEKVDNHYVNNGKLKYNGCSKTPKLTSNGSGFTSEMFGGLDSLRKDVQSVTIENLTIDMPSQNFSPIFNFRHEKNVPIEAVLNIRNVTINGSCNCIFSDPLSVSTGISTEIGYLPPYFKYWKDPNDVYQNISGSGVGGFKTINIDNVQLSDWESAFGWHSGNCFHAKQINFKNVSLGGNMFRSSEIVSSGNLKAYNTCSFDSGQIDVNFENCTYSVPARCYIDALKSLSSFHKFCNFLPYYHVNPYEEPTHWLEINERLFRSMTAADAYPATSKGWGVTYAD